MQPKALARNLAASCVMGAWTAEALREVFTRRLPPRLHRHAGPLAEALIAQFESAYAPSHSQVAASLAGLPGFAAVLRYCTKHDVWPAPDLAGPGMAPTPVFAGLDLPALTTPAALADWLLIDLAALDDLSDPRGRKERHDEMAVNHYHARVVSKRRGGVRLIEAPKVRLKTVQRQILHGLLAHVPVQDAAHGFRSGRSCLTGAAGHAGEEVVLSFDLADYFARIGWGRVYGLWRALGYPAGVARRLAGLTTTHTPPRILRRLPLDLQGFVKEAHLPQGAPTSPMLANLVSFGLDQRLAGLARRFGARYSRYADDLTFSGDASVQSALLALVPAVVRDAGFALNPAKTRVMPQNRRQSVTDVVVNRHLNIARSDFDRLKAVIHACGNPSDPRLSDPGFCAQLTGQIAWVRSVNPARGIKLEHLLAKALDRRIAAQAQGA